MIRCMRWLMGLAVLLATPLAQAGTKHYYYTDPQGTPLAKADASGNITARFEYTPYGVSVTSVGAAPDGVGYTGHVNDPESGFVYMQARYYDPVAGIFLSTDPVGPQAGNIFNIGRFGYVSGNPIMLTDPLGRSPRRGKDMEICDGPVPCDSVGPARFLTKSPFSTDRDIPLYATIQYSYPAKFVVLGHFKDRSCNECFDTWRYQLTSESGNALSDAGYSVMEHIQPLLVTGNAPPLTSEGKFIPMDHGVSYDQVGLTPQSYSALRSSDTGVFIFRQTFTVEYQGGHYPLSTVFYHKISWANLSVSTTTHVVRP